MALRPWRRPSRLRSGTASAGALACTVLPMPAKVRVLVAVVGLASAAVAVAAAWVAAPASAALYSAVVPHTAGVGGLHLLADAAVVALAGIYAAVMWRSRRAVRSSALGLAAGVGVVVAYLASESVKLLFRQERPCRAAISLENCPAVGDWSFPSNHMAIASGLALAMVMVSPRSSRLTAALVVAVGVGRVGQGAHYPHDLFAGLAVGVGWVAAFVLVTAPAAERLLRRMNGRRRPPRLPGPTGDDYEGRP
jgi:membrane-associated phospholipid phosphatase